MNAFVVDENSLYFYRCNLVRVVDGDTVRVDIDLGCDVWLRNESIRLYGINAPELRRHDPAGEHAKDYLSGLLSLAPTRLTQAKANPKKNPKKIGGGQLYIETHKDRRGKYGRYLGTFFLDGVNINQAMVDAGYAEEITER